MPPSLDTSLQQWVAGPSEVVTRGSAQGGEREGGHVPHYTVVIFRTCDSEAVHRQQHICTSM